MHEYFQKAIEAGEPCADLIYADYLEETGQIELAELLRSETYSYPGQQVFAQFNRSVSQSSCLWHHPNFIPISHTQAIDIMSYSMTSNDTTGLYSRSWVRASDGAYRRKSVSGSREYLR